jgi:hypothetical protein
MDLLVYLEAIRHQKGWSLETLLEQMASFVENKDLSQELEDFLSQEEPEIITEDRYDYDRIA